MSSKQTPSTDPAREARRVEFNRVFDAIAEKVADPVAVVCDVLGYKPHTIRVLRVKKHAWKVIPQAKLDILKRELKARGIVA